jgi:general secretion pathway protein I
MIHTLIKRHSREGFTLLEVLISMALIMTALLAVFKLQAQNIDLQSEADFMTTARFLAQDRISRIQCQGLWGAKKSGNFGEDFPGYRYEEDIRTEDAQGRLHRAKVRIFTEEAAFQKDFIVETYLHAVD